VNVPSNPFIFDRPVPPERAVGRADELERLIAFAIAGHSVRLAAPRRYGKTTLLQSLVDSAWHAHDLVPAYVDLSRVTSLDDVAVRIAAAYERRLSAGVWRAIRSRLGAQVQAALPGVGAAAVSLAPSPRDRGDRLAALHEVLELPAAVHARTGQRCLVVFDEFQDLLTVRDDLDGVLRSHLQHHLDVASYVFAGSQPSLMTALFGDRRRPLFDQARSMSLAPLEPGPLGDFIADTLTTSGREDLVDRVDALVALSDGHPQRAMLLAHLLFEQPGDAADPVAAALLGAVNEAADGLEQTWRSLTGPQRRVLGAVADGHHQLLSGAALERTGLVKSSQAAARDYLLDQTVLRTRADGTIAFVDPLLPHWIRRAPAR